MLGEMMETMVQQTTPVNKAEEDLSMDILCSKTMAKYPRINTITSNAIISGCLNVFYDVSKIQMLIYFGQFLGQKLKIIQKLMRISQMKIQKIRPEINFLTLFFFIV